MDALRKLQDRIRQCKGADRELDWEIGYHVAGLGVAKERRLFAEMGARCFTAKDRYGITPYGKARGDLVRPAKRGSREPFEHIMACDGPSPLLRSPNYTTDPDGLGACVGLMREVLPGWCWRIGTCCVSDDAWVAPDWNSPVHGTRFREQYGEPVYGTVFDQGVDIDRRPVGNVCLAFLEAILSAKIAELEAQQTAVTG